MLDWELHEEDVDFGRRMPTQRPISRPQSARMHRHRDATMCHGAFRQIAIDQNAALQNAQQNRDETCAEAKDSMRLQSELRAMHVEAFKESQLQFMAARADRYYAADAQRTQDMKASMQERLWEHTEAMADKALRSEIHADANKKTLRRQERHQSFLEQARSSHARSNALQQRAQLIESLQAKIGSTHQRKQEQMQAFGQAEEARLQRQRLVELSREIQRTQGRMIQLQRDKMGWRAACSYRDTPHAERLVDEKCDAELERMAELAAAFRVSRAAQPRKERPKSANAATGRSPMTSGIAAFSSDTPRRKEGFYVDATELGPRVTKIDPKIGVWHG